MEYDFEKIFEENKENFIRLRYNPLLPEKLEPYAKRLADEKRKEEHHKLDGKKEEKRIVTGLLGELAMEFLLQTKIVDWSVGDSTKYNNPDIPGYRVGIKTVEYGKFPVIFKRNFYPQIVCVVDKERNQIYICGLAEESVLNLYQDDDLIVDDNLKRKGTKTGFYGMHKLKSVRSILDLQRYKENKCNKRK